MTKSERRKPPRSEPLLPFVLILLLTAGCWGGYWFLVTTAIPIGDNAEKAYQYRGQFGDMFGAVNALFSAAAFAVLIYSMWLQRTELRLQREELQETRAELTRSADAQEEARAALIKAIHAQTLIAVRAILQDEGIRDSRRVVLMELKNRGGDYARWSEDERRAAERVCHTFDTAGMMASRDMIPIDYLAEGWETSLKETWAILSPYTHWLRSERNSPKFWQYYERLAQAAANRSTPVSNTLQQDAFR